MLDKEFRIKPFVWLKRAWAIPLLVVAAFFICLGLFCLPWSTYNIEWPAWVQAIGSVIAIFVAFMVPYISHRRDRAAARSDAFAEECRVAWLCECACKEAVDAVKEAHRGELFMNPGINSNRIETCAAIVKGLLTHQVPRRLVGTIFDANAALERAWSLVCELRMSPVPADYAGFFEEFVRELKTYQKACQVEHLALGKKAGIDPPAVQRMSPDGIPPA